MLFSCEQKEFLCMELIFILNKKGTLKHEHFIKRILKCLISLLSNKYRKLYQITMYIYFFPLISLQKICSKKTTAM
jgi:hypothetical protein